MTVDEASERSLQALFPDIAKEWHPTKNGSLTPSQVTAHSAKKVWWLYPYDDIKTGKHFDFEWEMAIDNRTSQGCGCPYLSGRCVWPGYNDLKSQRPDLMPEWDFGTNTIDPETVVLQSNKPANWICPKGHHYTKAIYLRVLGQGCKTCSRGLATSFPEQCFFFYTKKVFPDAVNSYKAIFDNQMELDIFIPSINTGIEYDGIFWHDKKDSDVLAREEKKYKICKEHHIRLFRIFPSWLPTPCG